MTREETDEARTIEVIVTEKDIRWLFEKEENLERFVLKYRQYVKSGYTVTFTYLKPEKEI